MTSIYCDEKYVSQFLLTHDAEYCIILFSPYMPYKQQFWVPCQFSEIHDSQIDVWGFIILRMTQLFLVNYAWGPTSFFHFSLQPTVRSKLITLWGVHQMNPKVILTYVVDQKVSYLSGSHYNHPRHRILSFFANLQDDLQQTTQSDLPVGKVQNILCILHTLTPKWP